MRTRERQGWLIVASLFVTLLVVFGGGYNTFGVFLPPLVHEFHWSREEVSKLPSVLALAGGFSAPLVGLVLDRLEARFVIVVGALCAGLAFLGASHAHSFHWLAGSYLLLGVGVGCSTLLPCSFVVANWFEERRGLAMGVTFAGTSLGGMIMTLVASHAIAAGGWRLGYLVLALPALLLVAPLVLLTVRSRPPGEKPGGPPRSREDLPGLVVRSALRTRSFWMIAIAQFCFSFAAAGAAAHLIAYLIGLGYAATRAALVMALIFGLTSVGKLAVGVLADRLGGRLALAACFLVAAGGFLLVLGASRVPVLAVCVLLLGLTFGAPLVLVPMVITQSLGLRNFGGIAGLTGMLGTLGAASGPPVAGRIFDATGSYVHAFLLFFGLVVVGAVAATACRSLAREEAALAERA